MPSEIELRSRSPARTIALARALGTACQGGELILLVGELGTGKTHFVRGLVDGLGGDPEAVRSPSYTLMHRYPGRVTLLHFDVYFTAEVADLERSDLTASLAAGATAVIEWADRFESSLPADRLRIEIQHEGPRSRHLQISWVGLRAEACARRCGWTDR